MHPTVQQQVMQEQEHLRNTQNTSRFVFYCHLPLLKYKKSSYEKTLQGPSPGTKICPLKNAICFSFAFKVQSFIQSFERPSVSDLPVKCKVLQSFEMPSVSDLPVKCKVLYSPLKRHLFQICGKVQSCIQSFETPSVFQIFL